MAKRISIHLTFMKQMYSGVILPAPCSIACGWGVILMVTAWFWSTQFPLIQHDTKRKRIHHCNPAPDPAGAGLRTQGTRSLKIVRWCALISGI